MRSDSRQRPIIGWILCAAAVLAVRPPATAAPDAYAQVKRLGRLDCPGSAVEL